VRVPDAATVSTLVQASAKGDEAAWNELVRRRECDRCQKPGHGPGRRPGGGQPA